MRVVPYIGSDKTQVRELLAFLPNSYPDAEQWLNRRLTDDSGATHIILLKENSQIIGVAIVVHKSNNRFKLATLYVEPEFQKLNGGRLLMEEALAYAETHKAESVYLTADASMDATLGVFLSRFGFQLEASKPGLYWPERTENVWVKNFSVPKPAESMI